MTTSTASGAPGRLRSFAEILGLTGLAVTQPLLDVLGRAPELFLFRDATRADVIVVALVVALVPAFVLWLVVQAIGLAGDRFRRIAQQVVIGGLLLGLGLVALGRLVDDQPVLVIAGAVAVAGGLLAAYLGSSIVAEVLAFSALATIAYVGVFLLASPVGDVVTSQHVDAAEIGVVRAPRSVVFLQFDEWPLRTLVNADGRIDPELYPNLAAFSEDSTWFRNTTTVSTSTTTAVPAILTGRYPTSAAAPVASEYPESLFTMLASRFDLDVVESVTRICPSNLCDGDLVDSPLTESSSSDTETEPVADDEPARPSPILDLLGDAARAWRTMADPRGDEISPEATLAEDVTAPTTVPGAGTAVDEAVDEARSEGAAAENEWGLTGLPVLSVESTSDLLTSIERDEPPTLHFLHVLLPHVPYRFLPSGHAYDDIGAMAARGEFDTSPDISDDPAAIALQEQRLILQAGYADAYIGQVLDRLRETHLYEDSIVVVAADHGVGLTPGGPRRIVSAEDEAAFPDVLYAPLLIKAPGLGAGEISDADAETVDILPTLVDLLGVELPWSVDGISLLSSRHEDDRRTFFSERGSGEQLEEVEFRSDDYRHEVLARNVDVLLRDDNPRYRLYDLTDAGELVGQRTDDLVVADPSPWAATIDNAGDFARVDPSSGTVPARLRGHVDGPADHVAPLFAIALNGRVAAVVETFATDDQSHSVEAMLVPSMLRPGDNEIDLYAVSGDEGARVLHAVHQNVAS